MKAIIHIGLPKTGTKTIQRFLDKNREVLKSRNISIPPNTYDTTGAQHRELYAVAHIPSMWAASPFASFHKLYICYDLIKKDWNFPRDQNKLWEEYWIKIMPYCRENDLVVFSYESLSVLTGVEVMKLKELLNSVFDDISVVLYLRRQPEYLASYHNTMISFTGLSGTIWDSLNLPDEYSHLAYHKIVDRWSVFGKDKIKIRIFDKQEFYDNDLLSDFAHTIGFDMTGLESVENVNVSINSAETEFLRLLNAHIPKMLEPWTPNPDRQKLESVFCREKERENRGKGEKAYHFNRNEAQRILDQFREGNDWIAREYLGREKLFSEDVSMYPEEVDSPHGLTLEKCAEITAHLWKKVQTERLRQSEEFQAELAHHKVLVSPPSSQIVATTGILLPRWLGLFITCFMPKKKNRQRFRAKYVKDKNLKSKISSGIQTREKRPMIFLKKWRNKIFPTFRLKEIEKKLTSICQTLDTETGTTVLKEIERKLTIISQKWEPMEWRSREFHPKYMRHKEASEQTLKYISENGQNALLLPSREQIFDMIFQCYFSDTIDQLFLEFGVFNGASINYYSRHSPYLKYYGFDSFEGLPADWGGHGLPAHSFDLQGNMPAVNSNVTLIKGWFDKTLPLFLQEHLEKVAFIHVDCDIYESAQCVLSLLKDRIIPGTIIVFDEYFNYPNWQNHEYKAFQEFLADTGLKYKYLAFSYNQAAVIIE